MSMIYQNEILALGPDKDEKGVEGFKNAFTDLGRFVNDTFEYEKVLFLIASPAVLSSTSVVNWRLHVNHSVRDIKFIAWWIYLTDCSPSSLV